MSGCGIAASWDGICYYCGDVRDGVELLCGICQKLEGQPATKEQLQATIDDAQKVIDTAKAQIAVLDKKG